MYVFSKLTKKLIEDLVKISFVQNIYEFELKKKGKFSCFFFCICFSLSTKLNYKLTYDGWPWYHLKSYAKALVTLDADADEPCRTPDVILIKLQREDPQRDAKPLIKRILDNRSNETQKRLTQLIGRIPQFYIKSPFKTYYEFS